MADQQNDSAPSGIILKANGGRWLPTNGVLLLAMLGLFVWHTGGVLLMVFSGLLLAIGLDGLANILKEWTPLPRGWALLIVIVLIVAFLVLIGMTVVPQFLGQLDDLWEKMGLFFEQMLKTLSQFDWAKPLFSGEQDQKQVFDIAGAIARHAASATLALIGVAGGLIVLITIAIFAAADPAIYRQGFLILLPAGQRERVNKTLSAIARALRWWFFGQVVSMLVLGVTVAVGLMLIGVELWLSLGVLTALLTFIPFLGPIIAGIPIVIVGFTVDTQTGLIVLVFYLIVQNLEGNILVPMIQHRAVNMAPALLISMQVLMGMLFGAMGLILAAPVTVVGMVAVRELYVDSKSIAG